MRIGIGDCRTGLFISSLIGCLDGHGANPHSAFRIPKDLMISTSIRRPIVAMVIAIVTVLAGLISMRRLPLARFPDIVPPQIITSTTYTGLTRSRSSNRSPRRSNSR